MTLRQQIATELAHRIPGATVGVDFGHGCLMTDDKVFAFARSDESAALKLPEARIAELIAASSEITNLVMGKRTMREWIVVPNIADPGNLGLLLEAKNFVASLPQEARRRPAKKSSKKATKKTAVRKATKKSR
jgi:hypothetical protein